MHTKSQQSRILYKSILSIILVLILSNELKSQSIFQGIGIEIGGGHNQLFWSAPAQYLPPNSNTSANRTDLSFTPTVRLNYHWKIDNPVSVLPFIGYNQFGGKDKQATGYQDQFWFSAAEIGTIGMYSLNDVSFGVGLKANYHLKVIGRWLGSFGTPVASTDSWDEQDITSTFKRWSSDAGVRATYEYQQFSINIESWFGITGLQSGVYSVSTIRANQYRVLIGYTL